MGGLCGMGGLAGKGENGMGGLVGASGDSIGLGSWFGTRRVGEGWTSKYATRAFKGVPLNTFRNAYYFRSILIRKALYCEHAP